MSDLRQAAQQALEALEYTIKPLCMCWAGCENCDPSKAPDIKKAITDLRAALAQQPVATPWKAMYELAIEQRTKAHAQRNALLAALRYWLPDETMIPAGHEAKWHESVAAIKAVEEEK